MQIQPKPGYLGAASSVVAPRQRWGSRSPAPSARSPGPAGPSHGSTNGAKGGFDGYGPLQPDPAGLLALPNGFHYTVVAADGGDAARQR